MPGPQLTRNRVLSTKLRAAYVRPLQAFDKENVFMPKLTTGVYEKYGA